MKELLVYLYTLHISILVPKRRGTGYQKTPIGHYASKLDQIAYEIGFDLYGLDGAIEVQTGSTSKLDDAAIERIVAPIAAYYGMSWRMVEKDEYLTNHPIRSK